MVEPAIMHGTRVWLCFYVLGEGGGGFRRERDREGACDLLVRSYMDCLMLHA